MRRPGSSHPFLDLIASVTMFCFFFLFLCSIPLCYVLCMYFLFCILRIMLCVVVSGLSDVCMFFFVFFVLSMCFVLFFFFLFVIDPVYLFYYFKLSLFPF